MSKIEAFWQPATADDVAEIIKTGKPIQARFRDYETRDWHLGELTGFSLKACRGRWQTYPYYFYECQVYREPKPTRSPKDGCRMLKDNEEQMSFCDNLGDLIETQSEWSQKTFGADEERGPIGTLKHLAKEANEAYEAFEAHGGSDRRYLDELADCFILLLDATRRSRVSFPGLVNLAIAKMAINKARAWQTGKNTNEPVEHVRSESEAK
jgi:hypothetical protein